MELTIDQALQQGVAAHKEGKLQEAEKLYRSILATQPQHSDANHNLGVLAVGVGKIEEALPFFKAALEKDHKQGQYWLSYIDAFIRLGQLDNARSVLEQGQSIGLNGDQVDQLEEKLAKGANIPSEMTVDHLEDLYNQSRFEDALKLGVALEHQSPDNPKIPNIIGAIYSGLGRYEDAITHYKKAIELKPDYAAAYNNLGNVLVESGKHIEAITNYNSAIEFRPDFAEAYNNLDIILKKLGRYQEAVDSCTKAVELELGFEAYFNLGNALLGLGKGEEAISSFNTTIELKPDYADAYYNLGHAFNQLGDFEGAISNYKKVIGLKPDHAESHNNLGASFHELSRSMRAGKISVKQSANSTDSPSLILSEKAISHLKKAIELKPDYIDAYYNLTNTLNQIEDYEVAISNSKRAIKLKPDHAENYNNIGASLHELGKSMDAVSYFKKAIELKPDFAEAFNNLGTAFSELEDYEKALSNCKKAIQIKSDFTEVHNSLGNTFNRLGKYYEAATHYELVNTAVARSQSLECFYKAEDYIKFDKKLNIILEEDTTNIRIAAISAFVAHQLKKDNPYPFCRNPLDFIHIGTLADHTPHVDSFIEEVVLEAENQKSEWEPKNKTTRLGFQTRNLIFQAGDSCAVLQKMLIDEINRYYSKFSQEDCSLMNFWPSVYSLSGWYVRLIKNGYQTAHIHPDGWISGVVYLRTVGASDHDEGAIELGLHGYDLPILDHEYPRKIHRPQPGDIILFPSSLFHRTIPFKQDTERCVIAFDMYFTRE